ncbi:hypothetical protein GCM10012285_24590 [Streptomyces kronopolitis]|uniref:Uncharacterized protein n=1 Tax=Streptomyces kronopolitis TaxID=1612435 RepID=A0ABQ2JBU7_9ACTN|nr:hypothetical protein GCM10012285_24590 [Streptomyces kronopolitis]
MREDEQAVPTLLVLGGLDPAAEAGGELVQWWGRSVATRTWERAATAGSAFEPRLPGEALDGGLASFGGVLEADGAGVEALPHLLPAADRRRRQSRAGQGLAPMAAFDDLGRASRSRAAAKAAATSLGA